MLMTGKLECVIFTKYKLKRNSKKIDERFDFFAATVRDLAIRVWKKMAWEKKNNASNEKWKHSIKVYTSENIIFINEVCF